MSEPNMSFPGWPVYAQDEMDAVRDVLASGKVNYWTGSHGRAFEHEFADYHGGGFAVALANGTLALEIGLRALGIGPGDDVIVPCRTFIATASAVAAVGARPVVADVDPISGNITAETISAAMTGATRAVIVVHLGGWPCEMDEIMSLTHTHGLKLVEDCAQAVGAEYRRRKVGTFGDAGAFSFCQDKIISTGGEGGMLLLQDQALWKRCWSYKDHGKNPDKALHSVAGGSFVWLHDGFGSNARMTEMQASIGRVQLAKLDAWIEQRRSNATVLLDGLVGVPGIRVDRPEEYMKHVYYRCYMYVQQGALLADWNRDRVVAQCSEKGLPCYQGSCSEIYCEQAFEKAHLAPEKQLPAAHGLSESSFCLL
ncbi:MAG: DegT/DnrJ/EryC1/StrS aminotransferase family protein, partial [Mariprofundaceae bacterium]|nr:DegT/DnrJ/EryC1/StrS aminotransferase family protein [Mariprofundaceae bacterium]